LQILSYRSEDSSEIVHRGKGMIKNLFFFLVSGAGQLDISRNSRPKVGIFKMFSDSKIDELSIFL